MAKTMFDMGDAATLHDRQANFIQSGAAVKAVVDTRHGFTWAEGVVIGWDGEGAERKPRVRFTFPTGGTLEKVVAIDALRPVFDPSRIPSHSESQFSPDMSHEAYQVAIGNDDLMREHCE